MEDLSLFKLPFEESIFTWQSKKHALQCHCYVRIYWLYFDTAIVIVSGLSNNFGSPITDVGEELINLVCSHFKLTRQKVMLLEHFPTNNPQELDVYYGVQLFSNHVIHYQLTEQDVERLLSTS